MNIVETEIPDVLIIEPKVYRDDRGFFMETWEGLKFAKLGIDAAFVQDNHSGSLRGVLRGLHYQIKQPQGKLVRAIRGEVFDVAVDLRRSSPTFGKWVGTRLSAENKRMFWVPAGFAHGFYTIGDYVEFAYKCTNYYSPEYDRTLLWNDPDIGIDWPIAEGESPILSRKDAEGICFRDAECYP